MLGVICIFIFLLLAIGIIWIMNFFISLVNDEIEIRRVSADSIDYQKQREMDEWNVLKGDEMEEWLSTKHFKERRNGSRLYYHGREW